MSERYSRQIVLKEVGEVGQQKLSSSHVAIVGCGGLGAIASAYLAGAGVGAITLVDGDIPDMSNVHRQVFYSGSENKNKASILKNKLLDLNPEIVVNASSQYLDKENIDIILTGVDIILECTDSMMCKYLVNDYAAIEQTPLVYGAIYKYEGYISSFQNRDENDVHLRDIFPFPNKKIATCAEVGVLNTIAGIIGLFQANEVLKILLNLGTPLFGKLLTYDCMGNNQMLLDIQKNWTEDLVDYYERNDYIFEDCLAIPELEIRTLINNRSDYLLYSVLSESEHYAIDDLTIHRPQLKVNDIAPNDIDKPIVLYCKFGRVSNAIGVQLIEAYPQLVIYSLKGGLAAYRKFTAAN